METKTAHCSIKDCKKTYRAKGYCETHYQKWRRGELDKKGRYKICSQEKCRKPMGREGLCDAHYEALAASRKGPVAAS